MKIYGILLFGLMSLAPQPVSATSEGILLLDSFQATSAGIGESGPVRVIGTQSSTGITALVIYAFKRTYVLTTAQLRELEGTSANGFQLSYAGSYPDMGGRTLYLRFSKGFTAGQASQIFVVVKANGSIRVKRALLGDAA